MYGKPVRNTTWYKCPRCDKQIRCHVVWQQYQKGIRERLLQEEQLIPAIRAYVSNKDTKEGLEHDLKVKSNEIRDWEHAKDVAFQQGMKLRNYPYERVQEQMDKAEWNIQRLKAEKFSLEKRLNLAKEQIIDEEGIRRLCRMVARNIDNLSKNQWEMLNKMLKLKITVISKELVRVSVALPSIADSQIEFSRL